MMKKGRILAVLFLTLLLTFSLGFAWGPRGYWGRYAGYGPWYLNPPLSDLTQEQIRKIGDLREKFLKEIAPLQEKLFAKRMELRSLWLSRDLDERKINALQREIIDLRAKIAQKAGELRLEISKVLTPEQREKLSLYGPWRGWGRCMMP
jgi:hypothetical protein